MARRFQRRGFRKPLQVKRWAWVTTVHNETAVTRDGVGNLNILFTADDWQGNTANLTKVAVIRRIIVSGVVTAVPEVTAVSTENVNLFSALFVQDVEDTDTTIIDPAAGTILQAHRVLHTQCDGLAAMEIPTAQMGTNFIPAIATFRIDMKVNLKLHADQELIHAVQFGSAVTSVLNDARYSCYGRVLMESP